MTAEHPTRLSNAPILNLRARKPGQLKTVDMDHSVKRDLVRVGEARRQGDYNNSLPVVTVEIPETVILQCPLKSALSIQASKHCPGCEFFKGIGQKAWSSQEFAYWSQKYVIRCGRVVEIDCGEVMPTAEDKQ